MTTILPACNNKVITKPRAIHFGAVGNAWVTWQNVGGDPSVFLRSGSVRLSARMLGSGFGDLRLVAQVVGQTSVTCGSWVASGQTSALVEPLVVPTGGAVSLRLWTQAADGSVSDEVVVNNVVVDSTPPTAPVVSTSLGPSGVVAEYLPSGVTGTVSSSDANPARVEISKDNQGWQSIGSSGALSASFSWAPQPGFHSLRARAVDKAGWVSGVSEYVFIVGSTTVPSGAELLEPRDGARAAPGLSLAVTGVAPSPSSGVTAKVYWRITGTTDDPGSSGSTAGWTAPSGSLPLWTLAGGVVRASGMVSLDGAAAAAVSAGLVPSGEVPVVFDVQVCFTYTSPVQVRCSWTSDPTSHRSVTWMPHAFGGGFPVADAAVGQVALWSGEFSTSVTDVSVPGYVGDLSVSRSYLSYGVPGVAGKGFGPGWKASLEETDSGLAELDLWAMTALDGTFALVDSECEASRYAHPSGKVTSAPAGVYKPVDVETAEEGARFEVTGSGATARAKLTDVSGTVTTWAPPSGVSSIGGGHKWLAVSVMEQGDPSATSFTRDTTGRVIRILAPVAPGVTCGDTSPLSAGCRALHITYATTTTATVGTAGNYQGQISQVAYEAWDPDKPGGAGVRAVTVATYKYDTSGRLVSVTDPRNSLSTTYSYSGVSPSGVPLLTGITPPGLAGWQLEYGTAPPGSTALRQVGRFPASGSGAVVQQARFVYDVPITSSGLPTMTSGKVALWGQASAPAHGFAVFGPDRVVGTSLAGGVPTADWPYADLQYTDAGGYVVNTAVFGAGDWQLTAIDYDTKGRVVRSFDNAGIAAARASGVALSLPTGATLPQPDSYATVTRYNPEIKTTAAVTATVNGQSTTLPAGTVLIPEGALVTDVWGPVQSVNGSPARTHTHTTYGSGPNNGVNPKTGQSWMLPTQTTLTSASPTAATSDPQASLPSSEPVLSETLTGYDPINGSTNLGATSGWILGSATSTTTVMGGLSVNDIVNKTVYDSEGRVIESRKPMSNGTDAGTTKTVYYTAGTNSVASECGNKPQWAGLTCKTYPAGPAKNTEPWITTTTNSYSMLLAPAVVTETGGTSATRTTTTTFLPDGRTDTVSVTVTGVGLIGLTNVPKTKTLYSATTGAAYATITVNSVGTETGRVSTGQDLWGRQTSYTDSDNQTTTTSYNTAGRVATVTDPKGTTSFAYDSASEHRGLVIGETISGVGSLTATYDPAGRMTTQGLPGGIIQTNTYDIVGNQTGLAYSGQGGTWMTWSRAFDLQGRVIGETTPESSAVSHATIAGFDKLYTYDRAERLIQVYDTTGASVGLNGVCGTRSYTFDRNGNRTNLTTAVGSTTNCVTTSSTFKAWQYDTADRVQYATNGQGPYSYDGLGRQTTIPAADTPAGSTLNLTIGYYDNDTVRSIAQAGTTNTFTLDATGRRTITDTNSTTANPVSTTRHYVDSSDNPGWVTTTKDTITTTTRYITSIGGDLGIEITIHPTTGQSKVLSIPDLHGDIVTSITIPTTGNATTNDIQPLTVYDEYGNPANPTPNTSNLTYGWVGSKQRAQDLTGLILMGARLYNPKTGLFTSTDPIEGGNTTTYTYPQDPINTFDLTGQFSLKGAFKSIGKFVKNNWVDIALTAASFIPGAGAAAMGVRVARVVKSAVKFTNGVKGAQASIKASRPVTAIAGRVRSRRVVANPERARNGARIYESKQGGNAARVYRQSAKKGGSYGHSSNLTVGMNGTGQNNFHVSHRGPSRWPHIGGK